MGKAWCTLSGEKKNTRFGGETGSEADSIRLRRRWYDNIKIDL
jgi:hypothetical protein